MPGPTRDRRASVIAMLSRTRDEWIPKAACAPTIDPATRSDPIPLAIELKTAKFYSELNRVHPVGSENLDVREAQGVCMLYCPVRAECLHFAVHMREVDGIWGGFIAKDQIKPMRAAGIFDPDASKLDWLIAAQQWANDELVHRMGREAVALQRVEDDALVDREGSDCFVAADRCPACQEGTTEVRLTRNDHRCTLSEAPAGEAA